MNMRLFQAMDSNYNDILLQLDEMSREFLSKERPWIFHPCRHHPYQLKTTEYERFVKRMNITDSWDDCWIAASGHFGVRVGTDDEYKRVMHPIAHVAYLEFVGDIPDKLRVYHKCGNFTCCNPFHLILQQWGIKNG